MKKNTNNTGLIGAIIFASLVVAGSIIFFTLQMKPMEREMMNEAPTTNLDESIAKGIESYIKNQQETAQRAEQDKKQAATKNLVKPRETDHLRGNKEATITVIEYSDYECPFCKRFHRTMKQVLASYGSDVNWIFRNFPLDFHDPLATEEAEASECVAEIGGNVKYWDFADLLFKTTKSNKGLDIKRIPDLAEEIGIDRADFEDCMASDKFLPKIKQDIKDGSRAGVTGTPGVFIYNNKNGKTEFVGGAYPFEQMKTIIDNMLQN